MSKVIDALQNLIEELRDEKYDHGLSVEISLVLDEVRDIERKVEWLVENVDLLNIDVKEMIKINLHLQRQVALLNEKMGIGGDNK